MNTKNVQTVLRTMQVKKPWRKVPDKGDDIARVIFKMKEPLTPSEVRYLVNLECTCTICLPDCEASLTIPVFYDITSYGHLGGHGSVTFVCCRQGCEIYFGDF